MDMIGREAERGIGDLPYKLNDAYEKKTRDKDGEELIDITVIVS